MALKSSREGLRKELVDYLGNIIIDENLKQNIINSVDDAFINNEELTTSVNELDEKIRNETSARESADTTLQENINAESNARESADSNLQSNINLETTARQEAISNIEVLINNGVLKMDLLWTNASPTSEFWPQTISLDLSKYKEVIIQSLFDGTYTNFHLDTIVVGKTSQLIVIKPNDNIMTRTVSTTNAGIEIQIAVEYKTGNTGYNWAIPLEIWGVR